MLYCNAGTDGEKECGSVVGEESDGRPPEALQWWKEVRRRLLPAKSEYSEDIYVQSLQQTEDVSSGKETQSCTSSRMRVLHAI